MDWTAKEVAEAIGAGIALLLGGLGIRAAHRRGPGAAAAVRTLRESLDRHVAEDVLAHERLATVETSLMHIRESLARAMQRADQSAAGSERLARIEVAVEQASKEMDELRAEIHTMRRGRRRPG